MKDEEGRPEDLKTRTRKYALSIVRYYGSLPKTTEAQVIGKQLLRAGTSVGAHYREAVRAKSTPDFVSKVEGALQELEESAYWLELLCYAQIGPDNTCLRDETDELLAILVAMVKKAKGRA